MAEKTWTERMMDKALKESRSDGFKEGRKEGRKEGFSEGVNQGRDNQRLEDAKKLYKSGKLTHDEILQFFDIDITSFSI